eukprot:g2552.t1
MNDARRSKVLHLSNCGLSKIPSAVFTMTDIERLDVGWNQIRELPADIKKLTKLRELWINSNPLTKISADIQYCRNLKILDARDTKLRELPKEIGRLKHMLTITLSGAPVDEDLRVALQSGCSAVLQFLSTRDELEARKQKLERRLQGGLYREIMSDPAKSRMITDLVNDAFEKIADPDEQRSLIRNAERLFPPRIEDANVRKVHKVLTDLRDQNERKKLKAELELKVRAIYFGTIKASDVEKLIKNIFVEIPTLVDIKFLLKYAKEIFPPQVVDIAPKRVYHDLKDLRCRLRAEREAGLKALRRALGEMYSDVEPDAVDGLVDAVGALFKRTKDLKKMASSAGTYFPVEFQSADAKKVRNVFVQEKRALTGGA